jgi:hypothetical protein
MTALVSLLLGALLAWTGAPKLVSVPDPDGAPVKIFRRYARPVLTTLGAVEVAVAGLLLVRPLATVGAVGAVGLGIGFLGYLAWARSAAPGSSCGCTASSRAPVGPRSYARAWLVVAGGAVALQADRPWWTVAADRPGATVAAVAAGLALFVVLFAEESWLLPLRRWRLRVSPVHGPGDGTVPVAATVELLERSLAWETAAPVVRSALLESWDDEGWRFLRFAGVEDGRPVTVLFALDATATLDTTAEPAVRMSVLHDALVA